MRLKRILFILFLLILLGGGLFGYLGYNAIYGPNVSLAKDQDFFVTSEDKSEDVISKLKDAEIFTSTKYLDVVVNQMSFHNSKTKPGRYIIKPNMSTYDVLNMLRLGRQNSVNVTIQSVRTIEQLAGSIASHLEMDSTHFLGAIKDDPHTSLCDFLPDTYEFYWSTDGPTFKSRMKEYANKFWSDKNTTILGKELTACEIITLASIVEKESAYNPEKPKIAGVYINRLNRGIPLQADPTVIYGVGDFTIRRVLNKHLAVESPYNTYLNQGLPPGPICMPSKASILAVLNAEKHDYIYFCAKADNSGTHAFAETLSQHNRNARAFQRWLNQRGIRG